MTKSPRKNVPDMGIELGAACMPSELASDRATLPGLKKDALFVVAGVSQGDILEPLSFFNFVY